jgi:hypothetical protein
MPEVHGRASPAGASLWGLVFAKSLPLRAGADALKIVWRMTGTGDLHVVADGPNGAQVKPTWLEYHGGSTWVRPGQEWGTGIVFSEPGCWQVHLWRSNVSGSASFLVAG